MTPRKIKQKPVASHEWRLYLKKGEDFYRLAHEAVNQMNWNGVGLASVHAMISLADSLLAKKAGLRAASESHGDVSHLLKLHIPDPETKHYASRLFEIMEQKNVIEYEARSFTEEEARDTLKKTERFLVWVRSQLPKEPA